MLNRATLIGHVGKEPEVKTLESGSKVATFPLATSERWKDRNTGEKKERTEWHRVVIWGDDLIAKLVEPYVDKGSKLYVEGKIRTRKWQDQEGKDRFATEIVVQGLDGTITLLDRKEGGREDAPLPDQEPEGRVSAATKARSQEPGRFDKKSIDDEIPF